MPGKNARALGNKPVRKSPPRWCIQFLRAYVTIYGGRVGDRPLNSVPISLPPRGAFPPEGAFLLGTPLDFLSPGVPNVPRTNGYPPGVPAQLLSSRRFPGLRGCCFTRQAVYRQELFGLPHGCSGGPLPPILPPLSCNKVEWYIVTIVLISYHCNWFIDMIDQRSRTVAQ